VLAGSYILLIIKPIPLFVFNATESIKYKIIHPTIKISNNVITHINIPMKAPKKPSENILIYISNKKSFIFNYFKQI
jgi:hypothetical protein